MKIAILGDIHSNLEALTAVMADTREQEVTEYLCVGDIVGYNANPRECLEIVRQELKAVSVKGNHDEYIASDMPLTGFNPIAARAVEWQRNQLTAEERKYLGELPFKLQVKGVTLVHATLDSPSGWTYVTDKWAAEASFSYQLSSICFYGHTHIPLAFTRAGRVKVSLYSSLSLKLGTKYFINVGSVGQPRDGDPRAAYALYDTDESTVELRRVEYDIAKAQEKVIQAGLPERLAARLEIGR
ncbi:MAG: metallophosphoesterase family protein [Verrucomicrobiota bacterium]|jgi:predicted phosphodiesterase|nr:metallophosphoesterase family protein [Verrucomicrobiota bacterium]HCF96817.1 metallophosphoesterase [Verrucomicrobiota bacterium]